MKAIFLTGCLGIFIFAFPTGAMANTKAIVNDDTGGDCASFGTWDPTTLTCTLTTDLAGTLMVGNNDITIDGAGHTLTGSDTDMGIYIDSQSNVTIKNLTIKNSSYGIFLNASPQTTITNTILPEIISFDSPSITVDGDTFIGDTGLLLFNASDTIVRGNSIGEGVNEFAMFFDSDNLLVEGNNITMSHKESDYTGSTGMQFFNCQNATITDNTFAHSSHALALFDSSNDRITHNTFSDVGSALALYENNNTNDISGNTFSDTDQAMVLYDASDNKIYNNTISASNEALFLYDPSNHNKIYHNNFINNQMNIMDYSRLNNSFNLSKPAGGNYFDNFNESSEGCDDADADGFCDAPYVFTSDFDGGQDTLSWTTQNGWGDAPVVIPEDYSNVLFLPGIEGSRLYEGIGCDTDADEEKLWDPVKDAFLWVVGDIWNVVHGTGDDSVRKLFLTDEGKSSCDSVYVKSGDVIDSVRGSNIYQSFLDEMDDLEIGGDINDWKAVAYDWRLSLDDLLSNGVERDGKIFYEEYTNTPYIEKTLRELAATSRTGKVTIVAHSNGGLLAKALLNKLGDATAASLVDKIVMVGAPQSGAPEAVGSVLVGYGAGIYKFGLPIVSNTVAKELAENSPMAYHLLPSQNYFDSVMTDFNHPVLRFAGDAYAAETAAYGNVIGTVSELDSFLLASSLNSSLIDYANAVHTSDGTNLDAWVPPDGITVSQIAGWGADTIAGIDFYSEVPANGALGMLLPDSGFDVVRKYRPIFTEDGDGIVPTPSALMMASSESVKRYWLNLLSYNNETNSTRKHKDIFEIPSLQDFIKNIITNSTSTLPAYVSSSQPAPNTANKKLTFFLHSPLTLQLTDASGNVTGIAEDNSMTQDIPDSSYGEFGEVKYIIVPEGSSYQLTMHGQDSGTFSLDMQETTGGIVTSSSTIASVPTTANTLASLTISGGLDSVSVLTVDENGDGKSVAIITPKMGETVPYDPSMIVAPAPQTSSTRSRSSHSSSAGPIPTIVTTVVNNLATTVPQKLPQIKISPTQLEIKRAPALFTPTSPKKVIANVPQFASVYAASQQPFFTRWGSAIYNGLYGFWSVLKKFFNSI